MPTAQSQWLEPRLSGDLPLAFEKWNNGGFSRPGTGIGGEESSIFPVSANPSAAAHASCQDSSQNQAMGSISYVQETNQYLLIFLCGSGRDPANPSAPLHQPLLIHLISRGAQPGFTPLSTRACTTSRMRTSGAPPPKSRGPGNGLTPMEITPTGVTHIASTMAGIPHLCRWPLLPGACRPLDTLFPWTAVPIRERDGQDITVREFSPSSLRFHPGPNPG